MTHVHSLNSPTMNIKYHWTPQNLQNTPNKGASLSTIPHSKPHMISYLCHVPGKVSFTISITAIPQMKIMHFSKMP